MSEFHPPLLVYDRIDRNKKIVRRLLLAFTLLMLPWCRRAPFSCCRSSPSSAAQVSRSTGRARKIESLDRALSANAMPELRAAVRGAADRVVSGRRHCRDGCGGRGRDRPPDRSIRRAHGAAVGRRPSGRAGARAELFA
jgi:hypothetical protein